MQIKAVNMRIPLLAMAGLFLTAQLFAVQAHNIEDSVPLAVQSTGESGAESPAAPGAAGADESSTAETAPAHHGHGAPPEARPTVGAMDQSMLHPEETHLKNIRQLTFGNFKDNPAIDAANYAEAYWAPDGKSLILQAAVNEYPCDQVFRLDLLTGELKLVSTGAGRVTCAFYTEDMQHFIYSSTHLNGGPECPPSPDFSKGYVWPVYEDYDIYLADINTGEISANLTNNPGYDAEGTIDWNTGWLYYASKQHDDIDVYRYNIDSGARERLTDAYGYDGGPFINYDGTKIVYRRSMFKDETEENDYRALLAENLIRPGVLELWVMDSDGRNKRQLTDDGAANFAPFLHPDNDTVLYCSNRHEANSRNFDLYMLKLSRPEMEPQRITFDEEFDGFPMFSPDGKYLVWCANRNGAVTGETNVFIAEWLN
jgi:tricorn protease-like protein